MTVKNIFNAILATYLAVWAYVIVSTLAGYSQLDPVFDKELSSISAKYGYAYGAKMSGVLAFASLSVAVIGLISTVLLFYGRKYSDYGFTLSVITGYILIFFDSDKILVESDIGYVSDLILSNIEGVIFSMIIFKRDMVFRERTP
jgi:hypothetical protein